MDPKSTQMPLTKSDTSKKRFRIVKLEERIAPGNGGHGNGSNATCGNIATCHNCPILTGGCF